MDLYNIVRKHALKNKLDYEKADFKSVMSRVLFEHPELKTQIKDIIPIVKKVVEEVNQLPMGEVEKEFSRYDYQEFERPEERFSLPDVVSQVVLRFAPEPSGYLHIGHAKALFINDELLKKYGGKFILRFDDTNPEKASQEYEDAIKEDLEWLGVEFQEETHTSDYMDIIYDKARELIKKGKMYLTQEPQEKISEMRKTSIPIKDRERPIEENLELFEQAIRGKFKEGEIVALYKGILDSPNTALRDPTLFRVIEKPHYRKGTQYRFWPTYDFAAPLLDSIEGITHAIRSKEYELRTQVYYSILRDLKLREPSLIHISRLAIKGVPVSKRLIRPLVEKGKVEGWDDIRLSTIKALRRRGIVPEAIREFVLSFGMGKQEKIVEWDMLLKINRKYVKADAKTPFLKKPVELKLSYTDTINGEEVLIEGTVYIDKRDLAPMVHLKNLGIFQVNHGVLTPIKTGRIPPPIEWVSEPEEVTIVVPHELFLPNNELNPNSLEYKKGYIDRKLANKQLLYIEEIGIIKKDPKLGWIFVS